MSKKKLNTNGTLLNLLLLGGAAVILKKRTGSLRGIGKTPINTVIAIWGDSYLVTEAMFCFGGWKTFVPKFGGGNRGYDLLYASDHEGVENFEKGIRKMIKEYPNYRVDVYQDEDLINFIEYKFTDLSRKRHVTITLI